MPMRAEHTGVFNSGVLKEIKKDFQRETENSRLQLVTALITTVVFQLIAGLTIAFPSQCLRSVSLWCGFCTVGSLIALAWVGLCVSECMKVNAAHEQTYYKKLEEKFTYTD